MKKLFTTIALASMMLSTGFGITSCQKEEVPVTQSNNTNNFLSNSQTSNQKSNMFEQKAFSYFGYQMFVNDEVLALGDIVVTVNYDGKTTEYKASEGQSASVKYSTAADKYEAAMAAMNHKNTNKTYSGKKLVVPTFKSSSYAASIKWKFVPKDEAFSKLDMNGTTDLVVLIANMGSTTNNISLDVTNAESLTDKSADTYQMKSRKAVSFNTGNSQIKGYLSSASMFSVVEYK